MAWEHDFSYTGVATFLLHSFQTHSRHKTSVCVHTIINTLDVHLLFYLLYSPSTSTSTSYILHSYIPAFVYIQIHTSMHPYIHAFIHSYMYIPLHSYTPTSIHPCIHTFIHPYIHTSIHPYIHTLIHSYVVWDVEEPQSVSTL